MKIKYILIFLVYMCQKIAEDVNILQSFLQFLHLLPDSLFVYEN